MNGREGTGRVRGGYREGTGRVRGVHYREGTRRESTRWVLGSFSEGRKGTGRVHIGYREGRGGG